MSIEPDDLVAHLRAMDREVRPGYVLEHIGHVVMPHVEQRTEFFARPWFYETFARTPEGEREWEKASLEMHAAQAETSEAFYEAQGVKREKPMESAQLGPRIVRV